MGRRRGADPVARSIVGRTLDLVAPLECAGCTLAGVAWCEDCDRNLTSGPVRVRTRAEVVVPVWSAGRYAGPGARAVSAYKDRGRADLAHPFGRVLARLVDALWDAGELPDPELAPLVLVPVPGSSRARRRRGMDHVREMVAAAAAELTGGVPAVELAVAPLLRTSGRRRDSAGLTISQRAANVTGHFARRDPGRFAATAGAPADLGDLARRFGPCAESPVRPRGAPTVLVVDDVVTTGSTLAECARVLSSGGLEIAGAVTLLSA